MRVRNVKTYYVKNRIVVEDDECAKYDSWSEPTEIKAYIYPASGKLQAEIYGERLNYILNMLYDGSLLLKESDGICVNVPNTEDCDYKIISIKNYSGHKLIELESVINGK